jgi:hypothetical protein
MSHSPLTDYSSRDLISKRARLQRGKHQNLSTLMRTVKESVEQTLTDVKTVQESPDHKVDEMGSIKDRMVYCKNALHVLQTDMQAAWVSCRFLTVTGGSERSYGRTGSYGGVR